MKRRSEKLASRKAEESCELCLSVPGLKPGDVAGPGICEPGALEKAVSQLEKAVVYVHSESCHVCQGWDKDVIPKVPFDGVKKIDIVAGKSVPCDAVADRLKVQAVPTLLFFEKGKEVSRIEGATTPSKDVAEILKRTGLQARN